ncbi:MAG: pro-sigmaK processing inhibitor BofA family protein [Candidatus Marsarchaeota archaeon]|jgi:hypothetical protein|nr:pro-sigmaK processing inhibitor BofA family protein [Candidatus Marsarchaeota archaeon]
MMLFGFGGSLVSEIILVALIALVVFVIFKLGRLILKVIFGIIANSILGIISIFALNYFMGMGILINAYVLLATALFGLPAVGTMVILRLAGVPV